MYHTVTKTVAMTVMCAAADSKNMFPPLDRTLKAVSYSPERERYSTVPMQTSVTTAIGVRGI